jgi:hypothetical protein
MAVCHSRCPALICGLILDIADVCLEWRQSTHVDQAVVLATINVSSCVFAAVARDDLTNQLEILIMPHVASSLLRQPELDAPTHHFLFGRSTRTLRNSSGPLIRLRLRLAFSSADADLSAI